MKSKKSKPVSRPYDNSRDEVRLVCERGYVLSYNEVFWIFCFTDKAYEARTMSGAEARRVMAEDGKRSRHNFRTETVTFCKF